MKILYVECGCCGHYHTPEFRGDCRDDKNRFSAYQIEAMHGVTVWAYNVWTLEDQEDAERQKEIEEGQDRESYSDDQDRESYMVEENHQRCFHCGEYTDECRCNGGMM